jgi:tetratricopeptide (TPR) repeat protein
MVNNLKAQIYFKEGNYLKCIKTLTLDEKASSSPHPSCNYTKQTDESSKNDSVYQKCQNSFPHYYFNNLGIVHLKLQKYNLAIFYFSKALKYVEKT